MLRNLVARLSMRPFVLFSVAHAVLTMGLLLYAFAGTPLDGDRWPGSKLAGTAIQILMFPGVLLWTRWASENLPNAVELLLFAANSALWGLFAVLLLNSWRRS